MGMGKETADSTVMEGVIMVMVEDGMIDTINLCLTTGTEMASSITDSSTEIKTACNHQAVHVTHRLVHVTLWDITAQISHPPHPL
jgi:hypothetical protein